jgi:hypothetical protein
VNLERFSNYQILLFIGDIIIFAIVTILGFASHDTLGTAGFRMLTTFVPVVLAWLLIAPHLSVYDIDVVIRFRGLWRPPWAMVLAAPMAAFLRGAWLGTAIIPVFVVVIGGVNALAILIWRMIFLVVVSKWDKRHG